MKLIRLIAADMDDTLLNAESDLTERTQAAVKRAMEAGAMFALASGRMTESMQPFAEQLGVNAPVIAYNGALVYDPRDGRKLFCNAIPAKIARGVLKMLEDMNIYVQAYPGEGYFCDRRCEYTAGYEKSIRQPIVELGQPLSECMNSDMVKLLAIASPEELDRVMPILRKAFPKGVTFMKSKAHYCEIVAEGVDKSRALKALSESLDIPADGVMAFGDGQNDASMIAFAGTGVAMENAVDECKRVAKVIAPRSTEDGVAQVIEQYLADGKIGRS